MTTPYTTGTVTLTNGSAVITGTGTAWQTAMIAGGMVVPDADGNSLPILSVDSNTQITAAVKWRGASGTYAYAIMRDTAYGQQTVANAQALSTYLQRLDNASLSALASLAASMSADKFAYATGLNTMAWAALSTFNREMLALGDAAAVRNKIGAFSTGGGTLNGSVIINGSLGVSNIIQAAGLYVDNAAGATSMTNYRTGTAVRWAMGRTSTAESGSNEGSNLTIDRFGDGANYLGSPIRINRRYGFVETPDTPMCSCTPGSGIITLNAGQHYGWLNAGGSFGFNRGGSGSAFIAGGNPGAGGTVVLIPHPGWYRVRATIVAVGQGNVLSVGRNSAGFVNVFVASSSWGSYAVEFMYYFAANDYLNIIALDGSTQISLDNTRLHMEMIQQ